MSALYAVGRSTLFRSRNSRTCWKVFIDEINERCDLNWTWMVINKKQLEKEGEKEDELAEWEIVVDEPFSEAVVVEAIRKWLEDRRYEFGVRMIEMEKARGSGLVKELRERSK